jgi:hypothetical protein
VKNLIYTLIVLATIAGAAIIVWNAGSKREPSLEAANPDQESADLMSEQERLTRMKRMVEKQGGLPVDLALKRATTEAQRERIKRKLAHQSQTKTEAADEARAKLGQIEARLGDAEDEAEIEKLKKQREALRRIIERLAQE